MVHEDMCNISLCLQKNHFRIVLNSYSTRIVSSKYLFRDYMPIKKDENWFVQFKFTPSYLNYKKYDEIRTNPNEVWKDMGLKIWESDIVLDGGNVVKWKDKVVVTERISKDNPELVEVGIYDTIKNYLGVNQLIVIPELKGELTGHSDGVLRFIDDETVVINDFTKVNKNYNQQLKYSLLSAGLRYIQLPNEFEKAENEIDDTGDYVNFLEMKDFVLIPAFDSEMDSVAELAYKEMFNDKIVESIDCREIAKQGGALNCISWNIKI